MGKRCRRARDRRLGLVLGRKRRPSRRRRHRHRHRRRRRRRRPARAAQRPPRRAKRASSSTRASPRCWPASMSRAAPSSSAATTRAAGRRRVHARRVPGKWGKRKEAYGHYREYLQKYDARPPDEQQQQASGPGGRSPADDARGRVFHAHPTAPQPTPAGTVVKCDGRALAAAELGVAGRSIRASTR